MRTAQIGRLAHRPHPQSLLGALLAEWGVPLRVFRYETVTLSAAEEAWAAKKHFAVRETPIVLTGGLTKRASNIVRIGCHEAEIPDTEFQLLLRLTVALLTADDGYLPLGSTRRGGGLSDEAIASGQDVHRWASDLRKLIQPAFVGLDGRAIIQITRRRIRLSAHPRLVSADRDALLGHPNALIRELAACLPSGRESVSPA